MRRTVRNYSAAIVVAGGLLVAGSGAAADPQEAKNNSWISVSGTVVRTAPDAFRLDYSDGVITVEMDDFDFYAEGRQLMENDKVVVHGFIDDDLFETRTIEASSVYVENLQTHFYASGADEEDFAYWTVAGPVVVGRVDVTGVVTSIDGREFTLNTGSRMIKVDTDELGYNPMDDKGFLRVDLGDFLKVSGDVDVGVFEAHELEADWIIEVG